MHRTQNQDTSTARAVDITPATILRGAARYLELHGWHQGEYYATIAADPFPPCCAVGAITMAAAGRRIDTPTQVDPEADRLYARALDALVDYLDRNGELPALTLAETPDDGEIPEDDIAPFDWNDAPNRTAEQVITALRAAADDYDWQHATEDDLETYADACVWREEHPDREGFLAWLGAR